MEASYHLMHSSSSNSLVSKDSSESSEADCLTDEIKRKLIIDTCNGVQEKAKVLNMHKLPESDQSFPEMKTLYNFNVTNSAKKNVTRYIPTTPERILDAPDFKDDYCIFKFFFNLFIKTFI